MSERLENCNPTICGYDLMTDGNVFVNEETIKEKCACVSRRYCFEILRLLSKKDRNAAISLLGEMKEGIDVKNTQ